MSRGRKIVKNSTSKSNVISQIFFAAVAVILGYLLLFDKTVQIVTLCQILCGGLIFVGVVSIVAYFLGGDFKRIDRYGFAIGVMLILAGIIGLIRIGDLTANFEMFAAAFSLVLGVLILQGTVQIKVLDYAAWILTLILTIACLAGAFCVLAGVKPVTNLVAGFSSWLLLICGGSCLFSGRRLCRGAGGSTGCGAGGSAGCVAGCSSGCVLYHRPGGNTICCSDGRSVCS